MKRYLACLLVPALLSGPVAADDFEDSLEAALEAYRDGDISAAKEEIDFAGQLLNQMKAEGLSNFLPEAMDGWTRLDGEDAGQAAGLAAFGGGQVASALYRMDQQTVEIQLMANNQMVSALGAMFQNPALMGAAGKVKRIARQKVVVTPDGEMQSMVDGRIMIMVSGTADEDSKVAYFKGIDFKGLKDF